MSCISLTTGPPSPTFLSLSCHSGVEYKLLTHHSPKSLSILIFHFLFLVSICSDPSRSPRATREPSFSVPPRPPSCQSGLVPSAQHSAHLPAPFPATSLLGRCPSWVLLQWVLLIRPTAHRARPQSQHCATLRPAAFPALPPLC